VAVNFHEFGLGIGWVKVAVNVCLLVTAVSLCCKIAKLFFDD
jgi:hypothetical protein